MSRAAKKVPVTQILKSTQSMLEHSNRVLSHLKEHLNMSEMVAFSDFDSDMNIHVQVCGYKFVFRFTPGITETGLGMVRSYLYGRWNIYYIQNLQKQTEIGPIGALFSDPANEKMAATFPDLNENEFFAEQKIVDGMDSDPSKHEELLSCLVSWAYRNLEGESFELSYSQYTS
ncbi:hypothetical protein [Pseudidiomarina aestuarii]|uniref:hypothetical protein n=1 Tax=Pseudidiomarina aestuarii TaxID=624146 RepID=UPI003A978867